MTTPTVVLMDIDGTLVTTGGAGRKAMERAFEVVCGRPGALAAVRFAGMTDRAIIRAGLRAAGLAGDAAAAERTIDAVLAAYLPELEREVARSAGYVVHPGVPAVVAALAGRPDVALGLGTGNIERGARIKLLRGDLEPHFGFGGFGCDHEDRAELLRIGRDRGAARLGRPPEACRTVIVGDTRLDVAAARAIGAVCVAVGTGGAPLEDLAGAGAHAVFPDLTAAGALPAILGA